MSVYKYKKFSTYLKVFYMFSLQQQQGFKQILNKFSTGGRFG